MSRRNVKQFGIILLIVAFLVSCQSSPDPQLQDTTEPALVLSQDRAAPGETVRATLRGMDPRRARVFVGGAEARVSAVEGNSILFTVPARSQGGPQVVEVESRGRGARGLLSVLGGGIVPGEVTLIMEPGTPVGDILHLLDPLGLLGVRVIEGPRPLGMDEGPCSGDLLTIDVGDLPLGWVLEALTGGPIWHSDPTSDYDPGAAGSQATLGTKAAQTPGRAGQTGAGMVIAVLDTGVSPHQELGSRLLSDLGHDFVDEDEDATEAGGAGHGTPIAVLAAGSSLGVAPGARVLPVRVCEDGGCYTTDITLGLCYALRVAENELGGMDGLVLNLSFGGDTPNTAIRAILDYATSHGALVAAAGGNRRQDGSPPNYPAASDLEGVVAVAALERGGGWTPAPFSTKGSYLDLAAPGVDLTSGAASGGYASSYSGTSFATALVSGGLALWREANPSMSAAEVEAGMKAAARPLDYPANEVGAGLLRLPAGL